MRTDTRPSGFGAVAPFDGPPPPAPPTTDAVALAVVIRSLWRARYWIVVAALVGGLAAAVYGWTRPQMYRATVTFLVRPQTEQTAPVNLLPYRVLLLSPQLSRAVSKETGIGFSVDVFENKDANILTASITLSDQQRAAAVANRLAQAAVAREREMHQQQAAYARDVIKSQMDEARERMRVAERNLVAFRTTTRLEVLTSDVQRLLKDRSELVEVEQQLAASRARLQAARAALAGQDRVLTLDRTVDRSPALAAEAGREVGAASVAGLSMKDQQLNTVYDEIAKDVATYAADVAGGERQRDTMLKQGVRVPNMPQLTRLYEAEAERARFEAEAELSGRVYIDLAARFEQARVTLSNKLGQLEILETADGGAPLGGSPLRNVILGMMVGALLATFCVVALIGVRHVRPMLDA